MNEPMTRADAMRLTNAIEALASAIMDENVLEFDKRSDAKQSKKYRKMVMEQLKRYNLAQHAVNEAEAHGLLGTDTEPDTSETQS